MITCNDNTTINRHIFYLCWWRCLYGSGYINTILVSLNLEVVTCLILFIKVEEIHSNQLTFILGIWLLGLLHFVGNSSDGVLWFKAMES